MRERSDGGGWLRTTGLVGEDREIMFIGGLMG
jgi:hypothetical protein